MNTTRVLSQSEQNSQLFVPISEANQEKINGGNPALRSPVAGAGSWTGYYKNYAKKTNTSESAIIASSTGGFGTGLLVGTLVGGPLGGGGVQGYSSSSSSSSSGVSSALG